MKFCRSFCFWPFNLTNWPTDHWDLLKLKVYFHISFDRASDGGFLSLCEANPITKRGKRQQMMRMISLTLVPIVALLAVTLQVWMMKMISLTLIPIIALLAVTLHVWMRGKISLTLVPIVALLAVTLQVWMMNKQFACAYCSFTCCHMTGMNDENDITNAHPNHSLTCCHITRMNEGKDITYARPNCCLTCCHITGLNDE